MSLINNTELVKKEEDIVITGADNTKLEQIGKIKLVVKINGNTYSINAYVIKGLNCKILLGNDFNIKNNLIINFKDKNLELNNDVLIPMDKLWYNYNTQSNNNNIGTKYNITSINYVKQKYIGKIVSNYNINIPPKNKINIKNFDINTNIIDTSYVIEPIERLTKNKLLTLESSFVSNEDGITLYNFSNLYSNIPAGMTIANIVKTNTPNKKKTLAEKNIKTIYNNNNTTKQKHYDNENINEITDKQGNVIKISQELNHKQRKEALKLINNYKHLFTSDPLDINCANIEPCEIKLKSDKPIFQPPFRVSPSQREKLKILIDQMIDADIIEPSRSNYAAPVFLIPKKEKGEYRFLVDYRKLNNEAVADKHPIPRAQDLFRSLEGAKYYSSIDMAQGYFQIPIREEDQDKTGFITDFGLFNFKRIPQGFKNSAPIFQRIINNVFSDYLYKTMIAYLDDICCFGNSFEEALIRLEQIFIRLEETGLKLKTNKCTFLKSEIELLGHTVSNIGLKPLGKNTEAIVKFPIPKKIKDVRAFVGLTSYYRKYIKDFAKIASPLTNLTKKENKFIWGNEQEISFETLKKAITTAPVMAHFKDGYPVFVTTDASLEGLSGILDQEDENGKRHPISYASRKLKGGERNFTTTELEMSAVVFATNYFREYLIGRKITVFSDHSSLQFYKTMKNPSSRITKFIFKLLEFDLEIKHRPGSWNAAADCLSRYPIYTTKITDILYENDEDKINANSTNFEINSDNIKPETLKTLQSEDEFCKGIILSLLGDKKNKYFKKSRKYLIKQELLYFKNWSPHGINNLLVIPKNLTNIIIKSYHESVFSGHFGITKTIAKLKQKYYWPTIIKDTTKFIKTCISCQMIKNPIGKGHGLLQPIPLLSGKPMQRLTFDYLGPLPTSRGKKYLIVATCNATKMAFAKAVTNANGAATISFLMDLITSYGVPKYFCSDRGTHFKNKEVDYACKKLGISQIFSSAYHPQTQGMTELMNKIICNSLSHYVNENQKDWSLYYKMIIFAYNTSPSSRLKVSPFYLLHGIEASQPIDNKLTTEDELFDFTKALKQLQKIRDTIPKIVEKEQAVQKKQYDISHKNINFKPGQKVLIKFDFNEKDKSKKLANKYRGPFTIIEKISDVNYKVDLILKGKKTIDIIHVQRIKPFYETAVSNTGENNIT